MTRIIHFFSVFTDVLFGIPDLNAWVVMRFRSMIGSLETDISGRDEARAFTDDQILQVFTLTGAAIVMGGIKDVPALEYAIKAVINGEAVTPSQLWMQYMCSMDNSDPKSPRVMPDTTFEQFFKAMNDFDPVFKHATDMTGVIGKQTAHKAFKEKQEEVVEGFQELYEHTSEFERERFDWQQMEIPDAASGSEMPSKQEIFNILRSMLRASKSGLN